ncbi:GNAT family N-acetyltransferase [Glycomyces salinus]|uniref:GNAT family N-acetyltransferase n=1 Tax=Glycomyces salinus TaxID=980294 RepID=UPI0018EB4AE8|nr:GNAT family N-acetyltransferase [Glycomyces salinus]
MQIIEFGADDPDLIAATFEIRTAAHAADTPENPMPVRRFYETLFTHAWPGRKSRWFAARKNGRVVGVLRLTFWLDSNPNLAHFLLHVHPDDRGQGVGSALLDLAVESTRAGGRRNLATNTPLAWEGGPARDEAGARFLEHRGFTRALTAVNRRCKVDALDPSEEDRLYDKALAAAAGAYELRQWVGPVPDDLLVTMCRMDNMIVNEIPLGDLEIEPEDIDTEKLRAAEDVNRAEGRIKLHSVALDKDGGIVAWSEISVDEGPYTAAHQGITIVDPGHRGNRLGLLTKLANLRLLRERFGHVTEIWTDNADVNAHMIAINEALGYETIDADGDYQRKLEM